MSLREGIAQLVVYEEEHAHLRTLVDQVARATKARAVLLIGSSGQLVAECGDTLGLDVDSFCTLAASNLAATATMARLVGEKDVTLVFHEGKKDSIHISLLGEHVILAVIFGRTSSLGLVRLRTRQAGPYFERVVQRILQRMKVEDRLDLNPLCEITEADIDQLFTF